eukprot:6492030-Amphidinium_carterae.2
MCAIPEAPLDVASHPPADLEREVPWLLRVLLLPFALLQWWWALRAGGARSLHPDKLCAAAAILPRAMPWLGVGGLPNLPTCIAHAGCKVHRSMLSWRSSCYHGGVLQAPICGWTMLAVERTLIWQQSEGPLAGAVRMPPRGPGQHKPYVYQVLVFKSPELLVRNPSMSVQRLQEMYRD